MAIKKFKDWRGWWEGLRINLTKTIGTTGVTFLGTNGVDAIGLHGVGMNWRTALAQFGVHCAFEIFTYLKDKPDAPVVSVEVDTETITKPKPPGQETGAPTDAGAAPHD